MIVSQNVFLHLYFTFELEFHIFFCLGTTFFQPSSSVETKVTTLLPFFSNIPTQFCILNRFFSLLPPPCSYFLTRKAYQQLTHEFYRRVCLCVCKPVDTLLHDEKSCHKSISFFRLFHFTVLFS